MRATVMYRASDVGIVNVPDAKIIEPTDAVVTVTRAYICGSDLWPYNMEHSESGRVMGHEGSKWSKRSVATLAYTGAVFGLTVNRNFAWISGRDGFHSPARAARLVPAGADIPETRSAPRVRSAGRNLRSEFYAAISQRPKRQARLNRCEDIKMLRHSYLFGLLLLPSIASACMVCDTELGYQVRRGVFDGNFASTALAVLLPFPAFLLAAAAVHFGVPKLMTSKTKRGKDHRS